MLCFIHIERAGGTTLHHILRHNFVSFLTLTPSRWSNEPEAVFTPDELHALLRVFPYTRGFGGHTTRVYVGYETVSRTPVKYFTFLRDPLERYVSHFRYQVERMGVPWSFDAFLAEPRFANFMTTRIAGRPDVARAKELLQTRFAFVGLTNRFDESLLVMRRALDLGDFDIRYERQNMRSNRDSESPDDAFGAVSGALDRIRARNLLDVELYDFVRTTIYPAQLEHYGPALSADLDRFRERNRAFRFGRRQRYSWQLYRRLLYQPVELSIRRGLRHATP